MLVWGLGMAVERGILGGCAEVDLGLVEGEGKRGGGREGGAERREG